MEKKLKTYVVPNIEFFTMATDVILNSVESVDGKIFSDYEIDAWY